MVNGVEHGRKGVKIIEDGGRAPIHSHDGANAHPRCRCKTKMCERILGGVVRERKSRNTKDYKNFTCQYLVTILNILTFFC